MGKVPNKGHLRFWVRMLAISKWGYQHADFQGRMPVFKAGILVFRATELRFHCNSLRHRTYEGGNIYQNDILVAILNMKVVLPGARLKIFLSP